MAGDLILGDALRAGPEEWGTECAPVRAHTADWDSLCFLGIRVVRFVLSLRG